MDPQANPPCDKELNAMELKAKELAKAKLLRAYLLTIKEVVAGPDGKPMVTARTICYMAPSFSHAAAMYDRPEIGVEILKQEFLAPGEVTLYPLETRAKAAEFQEGMDGLGMCHKCLHDYRNQPSGRCTRGHRTDRSLADEPCRGYEPKVRK